ncbi:hypothetical protein BHU09_06130 [Tannerella sp. oral taxon 808]|nr:hypothetical protein BHU09_06130 [Tannerella sp. oral taxon 808]
METMKTNSFREAWNETCLRAGLSAVSLDTAARIMAVLHVESGCTTAVTHSPKLRADLKYIQRRFGIEGGATPDAAFVRSFSRYVHEIEAHQRQSKGRTGLTLAEQAWPEWARTLYQDNYNVKLTPVFV